MNCMSEEMPFTPLHHAMIYSCHHQWSTILFLEIYHHEDFGSNHNRAHLTILTISAFKKFLIN